MKIAMLFSLFYFLCAIPANSSDFMMSDQYWKGKTSYMNGNFIAAFKAWSKPAESGIPEAQGLVAGLYQAGHGVKQDYNKALKLYQSAAKKGFSPAQLGLGNMHADGLGVEKDYIKAHMWFNMAAANGNIRGQYNLEKIEFRMSAKDIKAAEKLAQDWLRRNPQKL